MAGGEIASAFVRIRPEMKGFQGEVHSGVKGAFGGVGKIVAGTLVAAGAAAGAVGAGLIASAKSAISFEKSMRNVNSIAGLGEKQFKSLGASVTGMAAEVGQKPKILADGLYDLVSSGFKATDAITVLKVSARAATAGLTDAATASGAVAAALNAYHLEADDARKVSDILFQTVNKGVLTFAELAQNMGDLVPAAAPLGITLEEVGAAMSTITLQGVPAAEAATRVKNAMLQIATPSKGLSKLLKQNGYESGAAAIKALGFSGVLGMLSKATGGNVDALAELLPEMRGLLGVVGLTGKNAAIYTANLKAMGEASKGAGITAKVFAEQSKSLAVQWEKFSARIDVLKVKIGSALIPALSSALDHVNSFFTRFDQAEGIRAKLNIVWEGIEEAGTTVQQRIGDAIALIDWGAVWSRASGIADGLAARFDEIDWTTVGGAIGDGIADAVADSAASAKKLGDSISKVFQSIDWVPIGKSMGPGLAAAFTTAFVSLLDPAFWIRNWELTLAVALSVFRVRILKVFAPLGKIIGSALGKAWDEALQAVLGVIERFSPKIAAVLLAGLTKLPGLIGAALGKLYAVVAAQFAKLGKVAQFVVRVLGIGAAIDAMTRFASWVGEKVMEIVDWFRNLPIWIVAAFPAPGGLLLGIGIAIIAGLWEGLKSKWESVKGWLSGLGGAIKGLKGPIGEDAKLLEPEGKAIILGLETGMMASWATLAPKINALGSNIIRNFVLGIGAAEPQFKGKMAEAARNALQAAREAAQRGQQKIADTFARVGTYATQAFEAATSAHLTKMQGRFDAKIKKTITGPLEKALAGIDKRMNASLAGIDARRETLTPAERRLRDLDEARGATERSESIRDAEANLAAAQTPGRDAGAEASLATALREQADAVADLATKEAALTAARGNPKSTVSAITTAETAAREARQKIDDFVRTVSDLQVRIQEAMTPDPEAILRAQRALDDARWQQQQFDLERQAQTERDAADAEADAARARVEARADAERTAAEEAAAAKQAQLEREYAQQVLNYQSERDLQAEHLGGLLTSLQERLKLHPEEWVKINKKIQALFKSSFGPEYKTAGKNLGVGFAKGIRESFGDVREAANDLAAILARYLPHSPAEVGPLSKPINWKSYLTDGLKPGLVAGAVAAALTAGGVPTLGGAASGAATPQITGALAPLGTLVAQQQKIIEELQQQTALAREGKIIQVDGGPVSVTGPDPNTIAMATRR